MNIAAELHTRQELLDFFKTKVNRNLAMYFETCQRCGACAESCHYYKATRQTKMIPAYKVERVRKFCQQDGNEARGFLPLILGHRRNGDGDIEALVDVVFGSCTMCRRCTVNCPMGIDVAMIMRAARGMLTLAGKTPKGLQATVDVHLRTGNNMGMTSEEFVDTVKWMEEELQKDLGDTRVTIPIDKEGAKCLWLLNPREVKFYPLLLQAQAKIFYAAGEDYTLGSRYWDVTNYALFSGDDEAARTIARSVLSEADRLGVNTIVCTECGHGLRVLKYLAPLWLKRQDFQVKAFVECVAGYLREGRIRLDPSVNPQRVTYHDPCNQARSGGFIEEPRLILKRSVAEFVELTPHGRDNWCCGGGGGALTMGEFRSRRLDAGRIKAEQIRATGAKVVATSCHNCIDQISELNRHYGLGVQVRNTCEMTADALVLPLRKAAMPCELDERGYLYDPKSWSGEMARLVAQRQHIHDLTEEHKAIIEYVRKYYNRYETWPIPEIIRRDVGIDPRRFFPGDPETVFKVAGLANPGGSICWGTRSLKAD